MNKLRVYVDGYNLYYGALKNSGYRWLNLDCLISNLLPNCEIEYILYASAIPLAGPGGQGKIKRYRDYTKALLTIPDLEIIEGKHLRRCKRMPLVNVTTEYPVSLRSCVPVRVLKGDSGNIDIGHMITSSIKHATLSELAVTKIPIVYCINTEEKGTDVSIGARMVRDAFLNNSYTCVLISNDSDLFEPVRIIKDECHIEVIQINPTAVRKTSQSVFKNRVSRIIPHLTKNVLGNSQFPNKIPLESGYVQKPPCW